MGLIGCFGFASDAYRTGHGMVGRIRKFFPGTRSDLGATPSLVDLCHFREGLHAFRALFNLREKRTVGRGDVSRWFESVQR